MRRYLQLALLLLWPTLAIGQTTTVTGTNVVDVNGNQYANGTASAAIQLATGAPIAGLVLTRQVPTNSVGSFSFSGSNALSTNNAYTFTICAMPVQIGPLGNATPKQVCFSTGPITVSGASQDISTQANAAAAVLGPQLLTGITLNGNNGWTGNQTHSGTETFNGPLVANNTTVASINGILLVGSTTYPTLASALAAATNNTKIIVPCGTFSVASGNTISQTGLKIIGSGLDCSTLSITSTTGDVFTVTGDSFGLSDLTVLGTGRTAGAVIRAQARKGIVQNVRFKDVYRGFQDTDAALATLWVLENILWNTTTGHSGAAAYVGGGNAVSDITFINWKSEGQVATYDEPQAIVDDGSDTIRFIHFDMGYSAVTVQTQSGMAVRSSFSGVPHVARMIYIDQSPLSGETNVNTADGITISAGSDINVTNSVVTGWQNAINISGGDGIAIDGNLFLIQTQQGVKVSNSAAKNITITRNRFSADGLNATNTFDDIQVAAGTSFFTVVGNHFGTDISAALGEGTPTNKPKYAIEVLSGASANYTIGPNKFNQVSDFGTGFVNDQGNGAQYALSSGFAATPAYSFLGDLTTGFWHESANHIDLSIGGVNFFDWGSAAFGLNLARITWANGDPDSVAADTGISRPNANEVAVGNGTANDKTAQVDYKTWLSTGTVFAGLGTPTNGAFVYCSDCTIANPCAGGGTGALAKRLNGVWVCN